MLGNSSQFSTKTLQSWIHKLCMLLMLLIVKSELCAASWPPGHLVDLSWPYNNNTIEWPGGEPFGYTKIFSGFNEKGNYWYAANDFKTAEHCGTHLDAPYHFNKDGWKVADIPISNMFTYGVFINASLETDGNRDYQLPPEKLEKWEEENGPILNNSVVIISFGWAHRYNNKSDYLGSSQLSFPGISEEAAKWLSNKHNVVGVGVDSASVDHPNNAHHPVHVVFSQANMYNLEHLAITEPLPPIFKLVVLPMKMAEGTGAPCRVIAIL